MTLLEKHQNIRWDTLQCDDKMFKERAQENNFMISSFFRQIVKPQVELPHLRSFSLALAAESKIPMHFAFLHV